MLHYKIISDSSSDLLTLAQISYANVPLKIITSEKEYIDNATLDVDGMIDDLFTYKGTSQSSCPNVEDWKCAFGDADCIFCVTITSGLSGSCNAAKIALSDYLQEHPDRKGCVIDTLSAGPEVALIIEKLQALIMQNLSFDEIVNAIKEYQTTTHLHFVLSSLKNLANNGRVSGAVAKISGLLGIRVIGQASREGTLQVTGKAKGEKKALCEIYKQMVATGYSGGRVRIHHCRNLEAAQSLQNTIQKEYPHASVIIEKTRGLCSFYAENGGLLIGYEV